MQQTLLKRLLVYRSLYTSSSFLSSARGDPVLRKCLAAPPKTHQTHGCNPEGKHIRKQCMCRCRTQPRLRGNVHHAVPQPPHTPTPGRTARSLLGQGESSAPGLGVVIRCNSRTWRGRARGAGPGRPSRRRGLGPLGSQQHAEEASTEAAGSNPPYTRPTQNAPRHPPRRDRPPKGRCGPGASKRPLTLLPIMPKQAVGSNTGLFCASTASYTGPQARAPAQQHEQSPQNNPPMSVRDRNNQIMVHVVRASGHSRGG